MKKKFTVSLIIVLMGGFFIFLHQPAMAAEKDKYGGILRLNIGKSVPNIGDPVTARGGHILFNNYVLQSLVEISNEKIGELKPELATRWELAPDKSHYIFHLRKGVKFHDGTDFNARAAKWNLDRWIKSKRPPLANVASIDILDDYTIRANLKKWDLTVIHGFRADVEMISPAAFEKYGPKEIRSHPVGTGPFKVVDFKRDIHVKYDKFDDYWEEGLPYLDGIFVTMAREPMTALAMLKRKEIDAWAVADVVSIVELIKTGKFNHTRHIGPNEVLSFISKDPKIPWSDKRMRMALEYAIDKKTILDAVAFGYKPPIYNIIHSIPSQSGIKPRKYDPDKARQLIKEAGFEGLNTEIIVAAFPDLIKIASAMQGYLKDVGINAEVKPLTMGPVFQKIFGKGLKGSELVIGPVSGSPPDLFLHASINFKASSLPFQMIKKPEGYEELLNKALLADSEEQGMKHLLQLEKLFYDDCMIVPMMANEIPTIYHPYVKDIFMAWGGSLNSKLRYCWLDKKK